MPIGAFFMLDEGAPFCGQGPKGLEESFADLIETEPEANSVAIADHHS